MRTPEQLCDEAEAELERVTLSHCGRVDALIQLAQARALAEIALTLRLAADIDAPAYALNVRPQ